MAFSCTNTGGGRKRPVMQVSWLVQRLICPFHLKFIWLSLMFSLCLGLIWATEKYGVVQLCYYQFYSDARMRETSKRLIEAYHFWHQNLSTDSQTLDGCVFFLMNGCRGIGDSNGSTKSHKVLRNISSVKKIYICFFCFRLAVEHLSQKSTTPTLSYISIVVDSDTDRRLNMNDFIRKFHSLKHKAERYTKFLLHFYTNLLNSVFLWVSISCNLQ